VDERQTQIREGAGLDESRLNVEFIDLLKKWNLPVLVLVAAAAATYAGWHWFRRAQIARVDQAFAELEAARLSGSPDALTGVAQQYAGVRGVGLLARLDAADAYLRSVRLGVRPGASIGFDGVVAPEDVLTPELRDAYLARAAELYQRVVDEAAGVPGRALHAMSALFGLAAVAEARQDWAAARAHYERAGALAAGAGYGSSVEPLRTARIASLPDLASPGELFERDDLPPLPWIDLDAISEPDPVGDALPGPAPEPGAPDDAPPEPGSPDEEPADSTDPG
jgi:hypothetical protein